MPYWRLSSWYFFYFAFIGAFTPYFGVYLQSLGFSAWNISLLLTLLQVMRLFASNLWSWLADRIGRKTPIVCGATALCLTSFASFFFTTSFPGVFIGMTLMAFFWSASLPLIETLTLAHLRHQTERYGSVRVWGSLGFVAAVQGIGALLDVMPLSSLLWTSAALLVGLLAGSLLLPEAPQTQPGAINAAGASTEPAMTDSAPHPATITDILRQPQVFALLMASFLMSAAHGALYVFYSIHLVDHGYSKTLVGGLWSLGVIAEILVFMVMPRLLKRYSLRTILLVSFACAVPRFLMIGWGADSLAILLLAQVLHGATFGAFHAAMVAAMHHHFPGHLQTRAQALYGSISFGAGGMLGGLLSGQTWDLLGPGWTYSIAALFALAGYEYIRRGTRPA